LLSLDPDLRHRFALVAGGHCTGSRNSSSALKLKSRLDHLAAALPWIERRLANVDAEAQPGSLTATNPVGGANA
jgi:hypothetical protein